MLSKILYMEFLLLFIFVFKSSISFNPSGVKCNLSFIKKATLACYAAGNPDNLKIYYLVQDIYQKKE